MNRRRAALLSALALAAPVVVVVAVPAAAGTTHRCQAHQTNIVGTAGPDVLHGTPQDDVIYAGSGNDTVFGGGGDDLICGGRGADRLNGEAGNDLLFGGKDSIKPDGEGGTTRTGDVLAGGPGSDVMYPGLDTRPATDVNHDAIVWDTSPRPVHIDAASGEALGQGFDHFDSAKTWLVGSDYNDTIDGSQGRDLISGGRGADRIDGNDGNDFIFGDGGTAGGRSTTDFIKGGFGADEIYVEAGPDTVLGGPGPDIIGGFGQPDTLAGGPGDDQVIANIAVTGTNLQMLDGGVGSDDLDLFSNIANPTAEPATAVWEMASGDLTFTVDEPIGLVASSFEHADLSTFGATWSITGTAGADDVSIGATKGGEFDGLAGNDTFLGSAYDDTFDGGPGGADHSLAMGVGTDTCVSVEIIDGDDCENVS